MNLLKLHLHCSAQYHIFSTLLLSQNRSTASDFRLPPDVRGPVKARTTDRLRKSGALHQKNMSSITRISGSLRTSEGRTSVPFRKSGTSHQKKLSRITRISGPLRTSGRCSIHSIFSHIYRPRTTDPCRTSDPSRTPGLPETVGRPDPV